MNGKVDLDKMGGKRSDQEIKATSFGCYLISGSFLLLMIMMFLIGAPISLKFLLGCATFIFYTLGILHGEIFRKRFELAPLIENGSSFKPQTFSKYTENGKILTTKHRRKRIIDWIFVGILGSLWILSKVKPELLQKILEKCLLAITPILPSDLQYDYETFIPEMLNKPEYYFYIFFFIIIVIGVIGCFFSLIYRMIKK